MIQGPNVQSGGFSGRPVSAVYCSRIAFGIGYGEEVEGYGCVSDAQIKGRAGRIEVEICIKHGVGIEAEAGGGVDQGDGYVAPVVAGLAGAIGGTHIEVGVGEGGLVKAFAQAKAGVSSGDVDGLRGCGQGGGGARYGDARHAGGHELQGEGGVAGGDGPVGFVGG